MVTAAILFAFAAVIGAVMAAMRLQGRELPPLALALLHGAIAAAGLVTLILAVKGGDAPKTALAAVAGFIIAALGGAVLLLFFHLQKKPLPLSIMFIHGTVAVISFVLLLLGVFNV